MGFNGKEGEYITLTEAETLTAAWRNGSNGDIKGGFFGKDKLQYLLDESGSAGIRMYFGETTSGEKTLVLVAADADKNDIITAEGAKILDRMVLCPPDCGTGNGLNGNG